MPININLAPWNRAAPLQVLDLDWLQQASVEVAMLRLDLVDPELSGNKWYKLAHHLHAAMEDRADGLISLGGPHSNHLHALAAVGRRLGLRTVGLLRGNEQDTPTVRDLRESGMHLHWLGYGGYRARHQPDFWTRWHEQYPNFWRIPEGGGGLPGAQGCVPLVEHLERQLPEIGWTDHDGWWLAVGTGTTLAGLVIGEQRRHPVYGALAGPPSHAVGQQIGNLLHEARMPDEGYLLHDASGAGFGRFDAPLAQFMADAERATGILLEPVYTAKALMSLRLHVEAGYFPAGTRLVFVHTGGLQGRRAAQAQLGTLVR